MCVCVREKYKAHIKAYCVFQQFFFYQVESLHTHFETTKMYKVRKKKLLKEILFISKVSPI